MLHNEGEHPRQKGRKTMTINEIRAAFEAQADRLETHCAHAYQAVELYKTRHGHGSKEHMDALKDLAEICEMLCDTYREIQKLEKNA